jgi:hypothetical protein
MQMASIEGCEVEEENIGGRGGDRGEREGWRTKGATTNLDYW